MKTYSDNPITIILDSVSARFYLQQDGKWITCFKEYNKAEKSLEKAGYSRQILAIQILFNPALPDVWIKE